MIGGESMKRRQILATALCVLALAACNKKPEEAGTTQAPTTVQATTVAPTTVAEVEEATYFEMLQLAYNVAAKDADITEGLAVPDQLFKYATVDGEKANFKWAGLTFQSGGDAYEIVECYVSESGTSVIVFAKKEGINVLLIGESEPQTKKNADGTIKSAVVNLQPYENDTLERALW